MRQSKLRSAISIFLGFVLTFVTFLGMNLFWLNLTVLNSDYLVRQLKDHNVSQDIYDSLEEVYAALSMPSGVPTEVFTSCIDTAMIAQAQAVSIQQAFIGVAYDAVAPKGMHEDFVKAFTDYAKGSGMTLTAEVVASIEGLAEVSVEEYIKNVKFPLIDTAARYFPSIIKAFRIVCFAGIAVFCLTGAFLMALYRRRRLAMQYVAASFLGAGLIGLCLSVGMLVTRPYAKLAISPQAYYNAITGYLNTSMWIYFVINIGLLLLGAGILLLVYRIYLRHKQENEQERIRQKRKRQNAISDEFLRKKVPENGDGPAQM